MCILRHVLRLYGCERLHQAQKNLILGKAVYKIDTGLAPGDFQGMIYNIKIGRHIQDLVKVGDISVKI